MSAHKIYGVQGAGALYIKPGVNLFPLMGGGGQENKIRSGTQSVATIAAFGIAAELAVQEMSAEATRLRALRDRLFDYFVDCPYLIPTGDRLYRLPHHVSFMLSDLFASQTKNVTGKTLVRELNLAGIGISAGSACHSGKLNPSPILLAMGYDELAAKRGIRLTLGKDTTEADIDWTAMVLKQILKRLLCAANPLATVGC